MTRVEMNHRACCREWMITTSMTGLSPHVRVTQVRKPHPSSGSILGFQSLEGVFFLSRTISILQVGLSAKFKVFF